MEQQPPGGFPPSGSFPPQPPQTTPHGGFAQPPGAASPQGAAQAGNQTPTPAPSGGAAATKAEGLGFLRSLVDFSFEGLVSPRVLKIGYGVWLFMLVPAVFALFFVWYQALTHEGYDYETRAYSADPEFSVFCMSTVAFPFMIFAWVLVGRVLFERGILAFRQYDLNRQILEELKRR